MVRSRWVSTVLLALVAWYAAAGASAPCADQPNHAAPVTHHGDGSAGHDAHCTPDSQDAAPTQPPAHCLLMTGCAAPSLTVAVTPISTPAPGSAQPSAFPAVEFHSVRFPPETPPPIA